MIIKDPTAIERLQEDQDLEKSVERQRFQKMFN